MKSNTLFCLLLLTGLLIGLPSRVNAQDEPGEAPYLSCFESALNAVWPDNSTIHLLFYGHSVPAGYGARHEVHTLTAYPHQVLKALKERYPYAVINVMVTAIGGENSVSGLARFDQDVLAHRPDILFIDYALNDRGVGLEKARSAWESMIRRAQEQGIKVVLLTPSPDQRVDILKPGNSLEAHARQISTLAARYKTGLADPYQRFREIAQGGEDLAGYMESVNHPNEKGHAVIAREILKLFGPAHPTSR